MIIRIVQMTFYPEKVNDFLAFFEEKKELILDSEGCSHLELLRDESNPNTFFTYSHWESVDHLDDYRNSPTFEKIWPEIKQWFSVKPQAHSLYQEL